MYLLHSLCTSNLRSHFFPSLPLSCFLRFAAPERLSQFRYRHFLFSTALLLCAIVALSFSLLLLQLSLYRTVIHKAGHISFQTFALLCSILLYSILLCSHRLLRCPYYLHSNFSHYPQLNPCGWLDKTATILCHQQSAKMGIKITDTIDDVNHKYLIYACGNCSTHLLSSTWIIPGVSIFPLCAMTSADVAHLIVLS